MSKKLINRNFHWKLSEYKIKVTLILSVTLLSLVLYSRAEQAEGQKNKAVPGKVVSARGNSSVSDPTVSIKEKTQRATKFKDGDRIAFIGASITHGGRYHREIQLFYATRYPSLDIISRNFGIAGDAASGVFRRYGWDIAPFNPNRATINIGLNDISYTLYEPGREGVEEKKEMLIEKHLENMDKLVKMLTDKGILTTVITLTPVDETGTQERKCMSGVNAAIKKFSPEIKKITEKYGAEFIDITGEMERLNLEGQKEDPDFTLIGSDRVHPGAVGHLVMAYLILKAQGCDSTVVTMSVDASNGQVFKQDNCEISRVSQKKEGVSFTCLSRSLPFPVSSAVDKALTMVPFTEDLNQEILMISGLKKGEYELLIDGMSVFSGSAKDFRTGINLATNKNTPQYQQAVEVQKAVEEYAELVKDLRLIAQVEHGSVFNDLSERTNEERFKALKAKITKLSGSGEPYSDYYSRVYKVYIERKPKQPEMEQKVQPLFDHIYEINKPIAHKYTIRAI